MSTQGWSDGLDTREQRKDALRRSQRVSERAERGREIARLGIEDLIRLRVPTLDEELRDTPARVVRAFEEMTRGYEIDVAAILETSFDGASYDEMIVVRAVPFVSLCEHHLLPFTGHATVAYIPNDRVVGLSKLARVVDAYARRLQLQERLTMEIATALVDHLQPVGVGVVVRAQHTCMSHRGIQKNGEMITSRLVGAIRDKASARAEFLDLARS